MLPLGQGRGGGVDVNGLYKNYFESPGGWVGLKNPKNACTECFFGGSGGLANIYFESLGERGGGIQRYLKNRAPHLFIAPYLLYYLRVM